MSIDDRGIGYGVLKSREVMCIDDRRIGHRVLVSWEGMSIGDLRIDMEAGCSEVG